MKRSLRCFLLSVLLLVATNVSAAKICNQMMFWIEYAYEYSTSDANNKPYAVSKGWHAIAPSDCETVPVPNTTTRYYVRSQGVDNYLKRADWQWGGEFDLCVRLHKKDYGFSHDQFHNDIPDLPMCSELQDTTWVEGYQFGSDSRWYINESSNVKVRGGYPKPSVSFNVDFTTQYTGNYLNFGWTSEYATSCQAGGAWSGSLPLSDTKLWGPLSSTGLQTFSITCSNQTTSTTKSVNVNVLPGAALGQLNVNLESPPESYKPVILSVNSATIDAAQRPDLVSWISSIDGDLGQGGQITTYLSAGEHTITAKIVKNASIYAQKSISVIIDPDRPYLTIDSPKPGQKIDLKEAIVFSASTMFQGQNSPDASISWISNVNGGIGTGYTFSSTNLSAGPHEITVTATQNGQTDTKKIYLTVYDVEKNLGNANPGQCHGGNPINLFTGNKYHDEVDFSTSTESPIFIKRSYNSTSDHIGVFGYGWTSNIEERVEHDVAAKQASVVSDTGAVQRFDEIDGYWVDESSEQGTLERLPSGGWRYTMYDGVVKTYNSEGQIISIEPINGLALSYHYSNGQLGSISDEYGHSVSFTPNAQGYINRITDPDGFVYRYEYDANNNLQYVYFPDTTPANENDNPRKEYIYDNASFPHALTGLVDEENIRFATWGYDNYGRADLSKHADDVENFTITYNADGTTTTTNALGKQTTYHYDSVDGILKVTDVEGHQSAHCAASVQTTTYDPDTGFADKITDWRGNETMLVHNDYGQVTSSTVVDKGAGWTDPTDIRTTTTTQYNALQLPWIITSPGLTVTNLYTAKGRLDNVSEKDTTSHTLPYPTKDQERITDFTYTMHPGSDVVQLINIDGPRAVADTIQYEYDLKGNLIKVTNALGHVVEYKDHNSRGQPQQMISANGLVTDYVYSPRGWLESETTRSDKGNAVTSYKYYKNGLLEKVTAANGATLSYFYNAARQLDYIENDAGEEQDFDPNALNGAWKKLQHKDASGAVRFEQERDFDELGRSRMFSSPEGHYVDIKRDPNGNITRIEKTIAYNQHDVDYVTDQYYDAFDRLRRRESDGEATTHYTYDAAGNLVEVEVVGNAIEFSGGQEHTVEGRQITTYVYNGFGELIHEDSPATGGTTFYRDKAGNIEREVNSKSEETVNTYDDLNRLKTVSYIGASAENIIYNYDERTNNKGRLTSVTDQSGSQTIYYDDQGYPDKIDYVIAGKSYSIDYTFDKAGQLENIVYPSNQKIEYQRDSLGRIDQVQTSGGPQGAITLISNTDYEPFGPIKTISYGNGTSKSIVFDKTFRPDRLTHGWLFEQEAIDYEFDTGDRLREQRRGSTDAKQFGYDAADRLTAVRWSLADGKAVSTNVYRDFQYDDFGNRVKRVIGGESGGKSTETSNINPLNNQLKSTKRVITPSPGRYLPPGIPPTFTYDYGDTGELKTDGKKGLTFSYNRARRLAQATENGQEKGSYLYNASGQRVKKQANGKTIHFHYDLQGQLLAETDQTGALIREYVYLANLPIAMMTGDGVYDDVASTPSTLVGQNNYQLNAAANSEDAGLQMIIGDASISSRLVDNSKKSGKELVGLTIREQAGGAGGAKIDVALTAKNTSTLNMITVPLTEYEWVPTGEYDEWGEPIEEEVERTKIIPIPMFGTSTGDKALEINIVYADGSTHHETLPPNGEWVKLERQNQFVNVYVSSDGNNWSSLRQFNLPMLDEGYMGVIASNAKADLNTNYEVANDNLFYLHTDHLGSVYAVSSNLSKDKVWWRNDFTPNKSPFGLDNSVQGYGLHEGLFEMPLRFPGQYADAETGMHYNYFRDYDPETGRYLQSDPIGLAGGLNTYEYALSNPINNVDASGLQPNFTATHCLHSWDACKWALGIDDGFQAHDLLGVVIGRGALKCLKNTPKEAVKFKRWKVGDAIDKPLPDGSAPGWDVVRSRYWKNRAALSKDEFSQENLFRMKQGKPPLDFNPRTGKFEARELHHVIPQRAGGANNPLNLRELTPDQHGAVDPFRHTVPTTKGIR